MTRPTIWRLDDGSVMVCGPYLAVRVEAPQFAHGVSSEVEVSRLRGFAKAIEGAAAMSMIPAEQR